jgi:hypothetical protein
VKISSYLWPSKNQLKIEPISVTRRKWFTFNLLKIVLNLSTSLSLLQPRVWPALSTWGSKTSTGWWGKDKVISVSCRLILKSQLMLIRVMKRCSIKLSKIYLRFRYRPLLTSKERRTYDLTEILWPSSTLRRKCVPLLFNLKKGLSTRPLNMGWYRTNWLWGSLAKLSLKSVLWSRSQRISHLRRQITKW